MANEEGRRGTKGCRWRVAVRGARKEGWNGEDGGGWVGRGERAATARGRGREEGVEKEGGKLRVMVHETSKRVGEDGRGHYGNHGWVSGLRDGEMVWVMFRAPWNGFLSLCYQMGLESALSARPFSSRLFPSPPSIPAVFPCRETRELWIRIEFVVSF